MAAKQAVPTLSCERPYFFQCKHHGRYSYGAESWELNGQIDLALPEVTRGVHANSSNIQANGMLFVNMLGSWERARDEACCNPPPQNHTPLTPWLSRILRLHAEWASASSPSPSLPLTRYTLRISRHTHTPSLILVHYQQQSCQTTDFTPCLRIGLVYDDCWWFRRN